MRNLFTALAVSTLFAATPALAHNHVARSPAKTSPVAGDAKEGAASEVKPDTKGTVKKSKKSKKTETKTDTAVKAPESAPAK